MRRVTSYELNSLVGCQEYVVCDCDNRNGLIGELKMSNSLVRFLRFTSLRRSGLLASCSPDPPATVRPQRGMLDSTCDYWLQTDKHKSRAFVQKRRPLIEI